MAEAAVKAGLAAAPDPDPDGKDGDGGGLAGRVIDVAGVAAGVVLAVIVADMLSGGKISRWLFRKREGGCEDCGDQAVPEGQGDDS